MAPKLKTSAVPQTPKKRRKQMGRRKQPLPELSPIHIEATSADESEEPNLSIIMDLLVGINT